MERNEEKNNKKTKGGFICGIFRKYQKTRKINYELEEHNGFAE